MHIRPSGSGRAVLAGILIVATLAGCTSLPESNKAAEETAWELSYLFEDQAGRVVAVADFRTTDVPEALLMTFREDIGTYLATAFREQEMDIRVVTRDRVDALLDEQSLAFSGLTSEDTRIKIGEVLGADILVTGTIIWLEDDLYRSSTQLVETETGVLLGGSSWDFWFDTESGR